MKRYEVIIVGAGPAGSSAAYRIAEAGISVLLIDRKARPGTPKECAEGVGRKIFDLVDIPVKESWVSNRFDSIQLEVIGGGKIVLKSHSTNGYVLNRKVFDYDLAMRAKEGGAELMLGEGVVGASIDKGGVTVSTSRGSYAAKLLIAADGPQSTIAYQLGMEKVRCAHAIQYELEGGIDKPNTLQACFGREGEALNGYYWIFPKKDSLNVGLGSNDTAGLKERLNRFIEMKGLSSRRVLEVSGGLIPSDRRQNIANDRLLIVGDAAGHANPITGGGIPSALFDGKLAADIAIVAIRRNQLDRSFLSLYQDRWSSSAACRAFEIGLKAKSRLETKNGYDSFVRILLKLDSETITRKLDITTRIIKKLNIFELLTLLKHSNMLSSAIIEFML